MLILVMGKLVSAKPNLVVVVVVSDQLDLVKDILVLIIRILARAI